MHALKIYLWLGTGVNREDLFPLFLSFWSEDLEHVKFQEKQTEI